MSSYKKSNKDGSTGPGPVAPISSDKYPFIYMPVTSSSDNNDPAKKRKEPTAPVPDLHQHRHQHQSNDGHRPQKSSAASGPDSTNSNKPTHSESELALKVARRNAAIQKELRSRLINHGTSESNLAASAHEQLRRPPRSLYPNPKPSSSHTTISTQDLYSSTSQHRMGIINNGAQVGPVVPAPLGPAPVINRVARMVQKFRQTQTRPDSEDPGPDTPSPEIPGWPKKCPDVKRPCNPAPTATITPRPGPPIPAGPAVIAPGPDNEQVSQLQHQIDRLSLHVMSKDKEMGILRKDLSYLKEKFKKSKVESEEMTSTISRFQFKLSKVESQLELLEERIDEQDDSIMFQQFPFGGGGIGAGTGAVDGGAESSRQATSLLDPIVKGFTCLPGKYAGIYKTDIRVDYDTIISRLRDLNLITGHQSVELVTTSGIGGSFRLPSGLGICLYKNGFVVEDGGDGDCSDGFRPYNSPTGIVFMQDVFDGYFPTELQTQYPEGVSITIKDRRTQVYPFNGGFTSKGNTVGLKSGVPDLWPGLKFKSKLISKESSPFPFTRPVSPGSIAPAANTLPKPLKITPLPALKLKRFGTNDEMITLKLKNICTEKCYKITTSIHSTPQDLCNHLKEVLTAKSISTSTDDEEREEKGKDDDENPSSNDGSGDGPVHNLKKSGTSTAEKGNLELINSYPFGKFQVGSATFRDYGILTNSLIYFRPVS